MLKRIRKWLTKELDISLLFELLDKPSDRLKSYGQWVERGYKANGVCYAAVNFIARNAATIPFILYSRSGGKLKEVMESPLLDLLARPNARQGKTRYFQDLVSYLHIAGTAFIIKIDGGDPVLGRRRARQLLTFQPNRLRRRNKEDPASDWEILDANGNATGESFRDEDVLPLNLFNPSSTMKGLSPLEVASATIEQGNTSRSWNRNLLKAGARPSGILKAKNPIDERQRQQIINKFRERYGGDEAAGSMPLLNAEIEFQPTGLSPGEMEWLEGQRLADRLTAVTIGVASQILGDKDAATYSNYKEARKSVYQDAIIPLMQWVVDELNNWVVPQFGENLVLSINEEEIDALQEDRREQYERIEKADWLSVNERREATGFGKLEREGEPGELVVLNAGIVIKPDGGILAPASLVDLNDIVSPTTGVDGGGDGDDDDDKKARPRFSKIFNLKAPAAKQAQARSMERERAPFVSMARAMAIRQFRKERRAIGDIIGSATHVDNLDVSQIEKYLDAQFEQWQAAFERIYIASGSHFFVRAFRGLPKGYEVIPMMVNPDAGKQSDAELVNLWAEEARRFVREEAASKIVGIGEKTKSKIRRLLDESFAAEESIDGVSARIDRLYLEQIIPNRSEVIARTEVVNASNAASVEAGRQTGVALSKEWLAVTPDDGRVREEHIQANGQIVGLEEPFTVAGELLNHPGDSSLGASARNVIQCRCTVLLLTE